MSIKMLTPFASVKGFSLIEVMIALVIFSVGLIGLAGLQATAVQDNSRSYYRVQANFLAYDILDRMRANIAQAQQGRYAIGLGPVPNHTLCYGTGVTCTPVQIADADLTEWKTALQNTLPSGDGSVAVTGPNPTDPLIITVQWDDDRSGVPQSITITAEP